jgi:hypothetical protein
MAEQANQFAALRWRNLAPLPECRFGQSNGLVCALRTCVLDIGDGLAGQRRPRGTRAMPMFGGDTETIEQGCNLIGEHCRTFSRFQSPVASDVCCGISKQFFKPIDRSGDMLRRVTRRP